MTERLEDVLRSGDVADDLVLLLRGGVYGDEIERLHRQARDLARRFTWRAAPCYGVSVFAATPATESLVLATRMDARQRYYRIPYRDIADRPVLLPTFRRPHWTVVFDGPEGRTTGSSWTPSASCGTIPSGAASLGGGRDEFDAPARRRRL